MGSPRPDAPLLRWLALAGAGGAAAVSALQQFEIAGASWAGISVVLGLLAAFAVLGLGRSFRRRAARIVAEASIHAVDSATRQAKYDALSKELEGHKRLEQDLTAAKQQAEAATMAKGEFLATMSHEIRTPLNGILPMLELLSSSRLDAEQRELLQTALGSARQMLRIVDDILDYSKLEGSKLELETIGFNLRELLESVIRLLEQPAQTKGLRLSVMFDAHIRPAVRGDPTRLRQVLTNLVSNAVKFTARGSVRLSVTRRDDGPTYQSLRFEVRDTGIGIERAAAERLFAPFSQADASTTRLYGGTGLGLAICKRILALMGGQIGVDSEPGKGSTFWFEVSLLKAAGEIAGPRAELSGSRVLLLSADNTMQRRLQITLPNWGMQYRAATNTHEALEQLRLAHGGGGRRRPFHLLLADLGSIRNTALALHRNVHRNPDLDALKLVYLQGSEPVPVELIEPDRVLLLPRSIDDVDLRVQLSRFLAGTPTASGPQPAESWPLAMLPGPQTRTPVTPLPSAAPEEVAANAPRAAAATPANAPLHGRILLVEDNPVNLLVAQRLLVMQGLDCDTAENGEQALAKMRSDSYQLVLMDCQMPVLDGYTASRQWRAIEQTEVRGHVPIIAMTANAMAGDRQKCLDAGMDDYLPKPVARDQLRATLARWLNVAAKAPPAASAVAARPRPGARAPAAAVAAVAIPMAVAAPPLDPAVIADLRQMLGAEFDRLVRVFLEDSPRHLLSLQTAAVAGDLPALVGPAHSLKSASANLGALTLSEAAKRIELGGRQRALNNPVAEVARLSEEYHRVEAALRAFG